MYHDYVKMFISITEALSHACRIEDGGSGYTGGGFADFKGQGSWLEYTIDLAEKVTVRHATRPMTRVRACCCCFRETWILLLNITWVLESLEDAPLGCQD